MGSSSSERSDAQSENGEADEYAVPSGAANSGREVAKRVFAEEYNDATYQFTESDEERAPTYLLLPTGDKANRVFVVGTVTEIQDVGSDSAYWQARIVGPTGTFFAYAGQYQPEAAGTLRSLEPPAYVAVVAKTRTYETDDGTTQVSLQPETVTEVDGDVRDHWVVETARQTVDRLEAFQVDQNRYAERAIEEYEGVDLEGYASMVQEALAEFDDPP